MMPRKKYAAAFILFFLIEVIIAKYINDAVIRPYVGDILVVILLYCAVRVIEPVRFPRMPLYVLIFAVGIEILQYFEVVKRLGLGQYRLARIIIGMTFDFKDIICYAVGWGCIVLYERIEKGNEG